MVHLGSVHDYWSISTMTSKKILSATALLATLCLPLNAMAISPAATSKIKSNASQTKKVAKPVATVKRKDFVKPRFKITRQRPVILAKIEVHATGAGVPVDTALAVVLQESSFRPNVTGAAGEIGLMQLKCQTARGIGYKGACEELYDPDTNLHYGLRYLRKALNRGSVAYYNAGIYAKKLPEAALNYADSVETKRSNAHKYRPVSRRALSGPWGTIGSSDPIFL